VPRSATGYVGTQADVILSRVGAFVVDYVLSIAAGVLGPIGLFVALGAPGVSEAVFVFVGLVFVLGYFVVLEGLFGQTIGKRLFGIAVVGRDGAPITMRQSAVRNLLRLVDGLFNYALGLVVMLTNEDRQRLGDMAAETLVVRAY
jgi:uncharacterized RDD family membrane protein YckC